MDSLFSGGGGLVVDFCRCDFCEEGGYAGEGLDCREELLLEG